MMDEDRFDDVRHISLPAKALRNSIGVAFDFGGSRCKVAFKKRTDKCQSNEAEGTVTVTLAVFPREKLTEALNFVKANADYSCSKARRDGSPSKLRITGLYYTETFASTVETELGLRAGTVIYATEFSMAANAVSTLLQNASSEDDLFYSHSDWEDVARDHIEKTENHVNGAKQLSNGGEFTSKCVLSTQTPYLIACNGSGTGFTKVFSDGQSEFVNGTAEGGSGLLALSKLLIGTDDFIELMELAQRGDVTKVSITVTDCRKELNSPGPLDYFAPSLVVHPFGYARKPNFNGVSREDMARALVDNSLYNVASLTAWTALACNCQTVYFCGGVFEHAFARDRFFFYFELFNRYFIKTKLTGRALKYSSFLPVLGAVLNDFVPAENQLNGD